MPSGTVATAAADQGVVAEAVQHTIATRAFVILLTERHTQPTLQHSTIQGGLVAKLRVDGRSGLEPRASTASRNQTKVSPTGLADSVGISEHGVRPLVDGSRQIFLGKIAPDIGW